MSKKAIIKRLSLVNFKGLRNVVIDFNDTVTTISGRNGTGKTTIMDAFTWLLWGKDSEGNVDSKFGIKTNDAEGNFIPDLEHEVAGTLEIIDTETGSVETVAYAPGYLQKHFALCRPMKGKEIVGVGNHLENSFGYNFVYTFVVFAFCF